MTLASYAPASVKAVPAPAVAADPAPAVGATAPAELPAIVPQLPLTPGLRQIAYVVPNARPLMPVTPPVQAVARITTGIDADFVAEVNQGVGHAKVQLGKAQR